MKRSEARQLLAIIFKQLKNVRDHFEDLEWIAITIKYKDGRITIHSKDAPNRPKGLGE